MSGASAPRDWDAATYDRVAAPQESWAREVLERLPLDGDETVLDAGCGSGRATRLLLDRLPRGRVIGVDASPSMIARAAEAFRDEPRVKLIVSDLLDLDVGEPVDAVFSNATFHWVLDHDRLFARVHAALRPRGLLVAQCGGHGNVAQIVETTAEIAAAPPFREHLGEAGDPTAYRFADAPETQARLERAGFVDVRCWLEDRPALIPKDDAEAYLSSVCLGPLLDLLPDSLHADLVNAVRERLPDPLELGYVRLNISAHRPQ